MISSFMTWCTGMLRLIMLNFHFRAASSQYTVLLSASAVTGAAMPWNVTLRARRTRRRRKRSRRRWKEMQKEVRSNCMNMNDFMLLLIKIGENNGQLRFVRHHMWRTQARLDQKHYFCRLEVEVKRRLTQRRKQYLLERFFCTYANHFKSKKSNTGKKRNDNIMKPMQLSSQLMAVLGTTERYLTANEIRTKMGAFKEKLQVSFISPCFFLPQPNSTKSWVGLILAQVACMRHACLRAPCVAWPLLSPTFALLSFSFFFFLRPLLLTHFGETILA